jgi:ABC-type glycerol-3-phosphate transport system substrate-binding protein
LEFERACSNIDIASSSRDWGDIQTQIQLAITAGEGGCDLCPMEQKDISRFVYGGGLLDVTERVQPYLEDIPAGIWETVTGPDGRIYGLPTDVGPVVMYYRRDVFELAGLPSDPESVTELVSTWDNYLTACQTIKDNTGLDCFHNSRSNNDARTYEMMLWSQGLGYFNEAGELTVASPDNVAALELMAEFWDRELVTDHSSWTDEWYAGFSSFDEPVASIVIAAWMELFLPTWIAPDTAGLWGVALMPAGSADNAARAALDGGSAVFILTHSDQIEAAWALAEYAKSGYESDLAWRENGNFPAASGVYEDPIMLEPDPFFAGQVTNPVYLESLNSVPAVSIWGPNYTMINEVVSTAIQQFARGDMSAAEALAMAEAEITANLAD